MAKTVVHTKTVVQKKKSVCKKNVVPKKKNVHKKNNVVTEVAYEENEGDLSEIDDEAPAHQKLRGQTALVTAACPRKYLKCLAQRMAKNQRIPEDFSKDEFLTKFRRVFNANCNQSIQKATCHDEPHKRFNLSTKNGRDTNTSPCLPVALMHTSKWQTRSFENAAFEFTSALS